MPVVCLPREGGCGRGDDQLNVSSRNLLVAANALVFFATRGRPRSGAVSAFKTKRATHRFGQAELVEERRPHDHGRVGADLQCSHRRAVVSQLHSLFKIRSRAAPCPRRQRRRIMHLLLRTSQSTVRLESDESDTWNGKVE